jgi:hypothetical protein
MLKQKVHKLTLDEDTEFSVIGLSTGFSDYKLAYELNSSLDLKIILHKEKLEIIDPKTKELTFFRVYHFFDEENFTKYYVVKNNQNFKYLFPEKPKMDYFIVVRDNFIFEMDDFIHCLRQINGIVATFKLDNSEFYIAEYLTF